MAPDSIGVKANTRLLSAIEIQNIIFSLEYYLFFRVINLKLLRYDEKFIFL